VAIGDHPQGQQKQKPHKIVSGQADRNRRSDESGEPRYVFTGAHVLLCRLFRHKGEQRDDPRPFNRLGKGPLMFGAGAGDAPGQYFSPFGDEPAQYVSVFIIYFKFLGTEFADLFFEKNSALAAPATPVFAIPAIYGGIPILPSAAISPRRGPFVFGILLFV
jgi:hypothetical protein